MEFYFYFTDSHSRHIAILNGGRGAYNSTTFEPSIIKIGQWMQTPLRYITD